MGDGREHASCDGQRPDLKYVINRMVELKRIPDFNSFLTAARPLVVGHVQQEIAVLRPQIDCICQWLVPDDLLALAGLSRVEDAYTELLAWALCSPKQENVALICQRAWLKTLGIVETIQAAVCPQTQLITADGRPDLILDYRDDGFVVAVEAKTGSDEHETPGGGMQSVTYPDAVRSALNLPPGFPVRMVFLTPSGTAAENPQAINTTYAQFVLALALSLPLNCLPPHLRWSYSMLFTHMLGNAAPEGNAASGIQALKRLSDAGTPASEADVLDKLTGIKPGLTALRGVQTMAPFTGFSDAGCLYARNAQIVDEIFRAFYDDMVCFCKALADGIREIVPENLLRVISSKKTGEADGFPRFRHLWLADDGKSKHAHLRLDLWDGSLITKNELRLRAFTPDLSEEQLGRLWAIPTHEGLKDFCTLKGRRIWTFMKVKFELPEDNPITFAAERVVAVLKAMYAAETGKVLP